MKTINADITVHQFIAQLRSGAYAWPGGYPVYFVMSDGEALSYAAAKANARIIARAIRGDDNTGDWRVIAADINWEDPALFCCHTCARIESAYAEDEAA